MHLYQRAGTVHNAVRGLTLGYPDINVIDMTSKMKNTTAPKEDGLLRLVRLCLYIIILKDAISVMSSAFNGELATAILMCIIVTPAAFYALSYDAYTKGNRLSESRRGYASIAGRVFPVLYTLLVVLNIVLGSGVAATTLIWGALTAFAGFYFVSKTRWVFLKQ